MAYGFIIHIYFNILSVQLNLTEFVCSGHCTIPDYIHDFQFNEKNSDFQNIVPCLEAASPENLLEIQNHWSSYQNYSIKKKILQQTIVLMCAEKSIKYKSAAWIPNGNVGSNVPKMFR